MKEKNKRQGVFDRSVCDDSSFLQQTDPYDTESFKADSSTAVPSTSTAVPCYDATSTKTSFTLFRGTYPCYDVTDSFKKDSHDFSSTVSDLTLTYNSMKFDPKFRKRKKSTLYQCLSRVVELPKLCVSLLSFWLKRKIQDRELRKFEKILSEGVMVKVHKTSRKGKRLQHPSNTECSYSTECTKSSEHSTFVFELTECQGVKCALDQGVQDAGRQGKSQNINKRKLEDKCCSLNLIFPDRIVEITTKDEQQCMVLVRGFRSICVHLR